MEKFEEVKSVTILRSGKKIRKDAPKVNEKSKDSRRSVQDNAFNARRISDKCQAHLNQREL